MSNFTPLVHKEYKFDGDTVKISFRRLSRKHMMDSMPVLRVLESAEDGSPEANAAINDILNEIADIIPEYIESFAGLRDAEGVDIDIVTVVNDMYFMKLCAMIANDLMKESAVPGKA